MEFSFRGFYILIYLCIFFLFDRLIHYVFFRLIRHTERLLEEKEEKLCVKILRTLREMMAVDPEYGEKVSF